MGIADGGGELLRGFVASGCTGSSASGCQPIQIKLNVDSMPIDIDIY